MTSVTKITSVQTASYLLIAFIVLLHPVPFTLRPQGSCLSPEFKSSQQTAEPFPVVTPATASRQTSGSLTPLWGLDPKLEMNLHA